jgi:hypothetical protein
MAAAAAAAALVIAAAATVPGQLLLLCFHEWVLWVMPVQDNVGFPVHGSATAATAAAAAAAVGVLVHCVLTAVWCAALHTRMCPAVSFHLLCGAGPGVCFSAPPPSLRLGNLWLLQSWAAPAWCVQG